MTDELIVKEFAVVVSGWPETRYVARSRGQALSKAWSDYQICHECDFKQFLSLASARRAVPSEGFGRPIVVCGSPAFRVGENRQYVQFVRPGSDVVVNAHPLDVKEAGSPPSSPRVLPEASPRTGCATLKGGADKCAS